HMHTLDDAATAAMLTLPLHDALPIWQWWRVSGRSQNDMPDGITGATQPVGTHSIKVADDHPALRELPAGKYEVVVEAAREKGGQIGRAQSELQSRENLVCRHLLEQKK